MAIINGELADADEVLNLQGLQFKNYSQLLFNSDYIGFNSKLNFSGSAGSPDNNNLNYSTLKTDVMAKAGNVAYDSTNYFYWGPNTVDEAEYSSFDEFSDNTVDTNKWTVATTAGGTLSGATVTVTENSTYQQVYVNGRASSHTGGSATASSESKDLFKSNNFVMLRILNMSAAITAAGSSSLYAKTILYLGSTNILSVEAVQGSHSPSAKQNYRVQFILLNNLVGYRISTDDGSNYGAWTFLSGTSASKIKFSVETAAGNDSGDDVSGTFQADYVRFNTMASETSGNTVTSATATSTDTITNAILVSNDYHGADSSTDVTYEMSADNGSNYESCTLNKIHRFTNTGTQLKVKATLKKATTISEYAVLYNLY